MSDGSGIDFGTIRSRPLSPQGRDNWDRAFGKMEMDIGDIKTIENETKKLGMKPIEFPKYPDGIVSKDYRAFNPEDHEQLK